VTKAGSVAAGCFAAADLGAGRFRGKLCPRTSTNEYDQSLVADLLAKRGPAATERLLRSWRANDPRILGSDADVLEAIASGGCDAGLKNHTLAIAVWEATKDSRFDTAALPALLIVLVGVVPVVALMRASRRGLRDEP
jgi:hypothetical protein